MLLARRQPPALSLAAAIAVEPFSGPSPAHSNSTNELDVDPDQEEVLKADVQLAGCSWQGKSTGSSNSMSGTARVSTGMEVRPAH